MSKKITTNDGCINVIGQPTDPNEEWRQYLQEHSEKYKADTSPERFTEEETSMLYSLFRRRKDGDLSVYAEQLDAINEVRLTEFFKYLPYAMATLGQHKDDKNIQAFIDATTVVTDFLFYLAELRAGYQNVAEFLKEYSDAEMAYLW